VVFIILSFPKYVRGDKFILEKLW